MNEETQSNEAPAPKGKRAPKAKQAKPDVAPEGQLAMDAEQAIAEAAPSNPEADVERMIAEAAEIATIGPAEVPTEAPLSSLGSDELKALCVSLNAQIITLHGEGKHEEGDALRVKHLNALTALRHASNPTGHA